MGYLTNYRASSMYRTLSRIFLLGAILSTANFPQHPKSSALLARLVSVRRQT